MPERFLFVELGGLERAVPRCTGKEMEILLLLTRSEPALAASFAPSSSRCSPPRRSTCFPSAATASTCPSARPSTTSCPTACARSTSRCSAWQRVEGYAADGSAPQPFLPFYAANDLSRNPEHRAYYMLDASPRPASPASRASADRARAIWGTRSTSRWSTPSRRRIRHGLRQLGLDLLCTNRDLPLSMPVGKQHTDFTIAVSAPVAAVRCLIGPANPRPSRSDGEYAWRFISHLGLNYLSLVDTDAMQGAAALRELLRLYVPSTTSIAARQLEGLTSVACAPDHPAHPRRRAESRSDGGCEITLTIDETPFGGAGGILLAAVLDRFFAKYVSINAFTETVLKNPERGEVMRWPLRIGQRSVL